MTCSSISEGWICILFPRPDPRISRETQIYPGLNHTLVRLSDGSLWGFGDNNCNAFVIGSGCVSGLNNIDHPVKASDDAIQATSSQRQSMWVATDGALWGIGENVVGSLGVGSLSPVLTPTIVTRNVQKVRGFDNGGGKASVFVLKNDGTLWGVGDNSLGQLGIGSVISTELLVKVADSVVDMGGGNAFGYFLKKDGTLWGTGVLNATGWNYQTPTKVMDSVALIPERAKKSLLIVRENREILGVGRNVYGELGVGHANSVDNWSIVSGLPNKRIRTISMGGLHTLILMENGEVWGMGGNDCSILLQDSLVEFVLSPSFLMGGVRNAKAGFRNSFFVFEDGSMLAAGMNTYGGLGIGTVGMDVKGRVKF